jgi:hypothetical protein
VTTASVIVEIIQDSIGFIDGKTSSKDGINPASVKSVSDEEVSGNLMAKNVGGNLERGETQNFV